MVLASHSFLLALPSAGGTEWGAATFPRQPSRPGVSEQACISPALDVIQKIPDLCTCYRQHAHWDQQCLQPSHPRTPLGPDASVPAQRTAGTHSHGGTERVPAFPVASCAQAGRGMSQP